MKTRLITAILVLMAGLLVLASQCTNDNMRPVPLFTVDRVNGPSPLTVNFDGSGSYAQDGTIESYSWDFGDGIFGTGITTTHVFTSSTERAYTVKLTVTDNAGKTGSMSGSIVVTSSPNGTTFSVLQLSYDALVKALVAGIPSGIAQQLADGGSQLEKDGALLASHSSVGTLGFIPAVSASSCLGVLYLSQEVGGVRLRQGYYVLRVEDDKQSVTAIDVHGNDHAAGSLHKYGESVVWEVNLGVLFHYIVDEPSGETRATGNKGGFAVGGFNAA